MKAIIMAGGEGSRLRPLTDSLPKPMVPVMSRPVMEYIISLLRRHHIIDIGITLKFMPDVIREHFGDGSRFGVRITYFTETVPLGTAGSVKNAQNFLDDTFFVISGDALTDINLSDALRFHREKQADATLIVKQVENPLEYGIVVTDSEQNVIRFLEKPTWSEVFSDTANTGIYILEPDILNQFSQNRAFDFSKDLFPLLMDQKKKLVAYNTNGYWCDIGDLSSYLQCHYDILDKKITLPIPAKEVLPGIWMGDGVQVAKGAKLTAPLMLASGVSVGSGAEAGPYCVADEYAVIEGRIENSIIGKLTQIKENASVTMSITASDCVVSSGSQIQGNCVIGRNVTLGENVIVKPSIKIWPDKVVDADMTIGRNLVSGTHYGKRLFEERTLSGEINVDISPETISKIASIFAGLEQKGRFALGYDASAEALMFYYAACAGLLSAGANAYLLGMTLLPAVREAVQRENLSGGIYIRIENGHIILCLINSSGGDITKETQRSIETLFSREDFSRCEAHDIKPISHDPSHLDRYTDGLCRFFPSLPLSILCNTQNGLIHQILSRVAYQNSLSLYSTALEHSVQNEKQLKALSQQFDLTAIIEQDCTTIHLMDKQGNLVRPDQLELIKAVLYLNLNLSGKCLYIPNTAPDELEALAQKYQCRIIRTKSSPEDRMEALCHDRMQFRIQFDAIFCLLLLCDYLHRNQLTFSELLSSLPDSHMAQKEAVCPSQYKGEVIRMLIQKNQDKKLELSEGVKIFLNQGWVLIVPDHYRQVCRIITQGFSEEYADELAQFYKSQIEAFKK